jgi:hypothetical protein
MSATCILSLTVVEEMIRTTTIRAMHVYDSRNGDVYIANMSYDEHARRYM